MISKLNNSILRVSILQRQASDLNFIFIVNHQIFSSILFRGADKEVCDMCEAPFIAAITYANVVVLCVDIPHVDESPGMLRCHVATLSVLSCTQIL